MPDTSTLLLIVTIAIVLGFDYTNGFHDTANAVATSISTRALSPRTAIALSALLNLAGGVLAIQFLHTKVANTVGGLISPHGGVSLPMIIAAIAAAIVWNLVTWRAGLPSSSSHALIGGLIGMGIAGYGVHAVNWGKLIPVVIGLITSPLVGVAVAYLFMLIVLRVFRKAHPGVANRRFRLTQVVTSSLVSFSHGANDAQKSMAVITLALVTTHHVTAKAGAFPSPPLWVVFACATAIALGTYSGGWRIIRTMGHRINRLEPVDGFVAESVAAAVIQGATQLGLPVSTTHVVSGSIMGAGMPRHFRAVKWAIARRIFGAWLLTIPVTAFIAALAALFVSHVIGAQ